ncbi:zeta toxin [Aureococcus anophagefferens]|nr:zeta toxin [Aureococcus anophagefferens]
MGVFFADPPPRPPPPIRLKKARSFRRMKTQAPAFGDDEGREVFGGPRQESPMSGAQRALRRLSTMGAADDADDAVDARESEASVRASLCERMASRVADSPGALARLRRPTRAELRHVFDAIAEGGDSITEREFRRPWVVFTCGPMGAGKGHALSWLSEHGFFPLENIVHVDPDLFKQLMPEWRGYLARDPRRERYPHYRLAIFYVTCSEATARRRAKARGRTGRAIPRRSSSSRWRRRTPLRLLTPHVDFLARMSNEVDGAPPSLDAVEAVDNSGDFAALRRRAAHTLTFGEPAEMPANAAAALRGRWRPLEDGPWPEGPASKRASAFLFLAPREMVLGTRHAPHGGVAFLFGAVPASGGGAHAEEHSPTGATSVRLFPIRGDLE